MRNILSVEGGGLRIGDLPLGCQLCLEGAKLVVFVTGNCPLQCYYCPISTERRNLDASYANEREVKNIDEILQEGEVSNAEGASITGGEPFYVFSRTVNIIKALKQHFGADFHIHLYTGITDISPLQIQKLEEAGLDEIRLHNILAIDPNHLTLLLNSRIQVGIEIPAIPGTFLEITKMIQYLLDVSQGLEGDKHVFLNLNEFEASETNIDELRQRGFRLRKNAIAEVEGSEELANQVLEWARPYSRISVHYCPSRSKDTVQLRNRFLRRAQNIRRPYEEISSEGLLTKGVVLIPTDQEREQGHVDTRDKNFDCENKDPNLGCDLGIDVAG